MPRYIFANVGRGNIFRQIRAFAVCKSVAKSYGRRGWAEIGESDGRVDEPYRMRLAFPKRKWKTFFVGTHVPVTVPRWTRCTADRLFAAKGVSGAFPTKYWVQVEFPDDKVIMWNGHLPPGAFNATKDTHEKERILAWRKMWDMMEDGVAKQVAQGWNVVVMCDANRQVGMPSPHATSVRMYSHKTDYIFAVPAKGNKVVRGGRKGSKPLGIDFHEVIWADIDFAKK